MIDNQASLQQAMGQLSQLYLALTDLRDTVLPKSRQRFDLMAGGILADIRQLEQEVAVFTGRADAEEDAPDIWIRVSGGPELSGAEAPTSVLAYFTETFRKGVQMAAEYLQAGMVSSRPTQALKRACDFRIVALQPGSIRVGLSLPQQAEPGEMEEVVPRELVTRALDEYLVVADWVASTRTEEEMARTTEDTELLSILLREVSRMAPPPRGEVDAVEFRGRAVPKAELRLTRGSYDRARKALDRTMAWMPMKLVGDLREIDLDKRTFTLRNLEGGGQEVPCRVGVPILPLAIAALDHRVEVRGAQALKAGRKTKQPLVEVRWLAILGEAEPEHPLRQERPG